MIPYYVYLLLCQEEAADPVYAKVGRSVSPRKRARALVTGCPFPVRQLYIAEVGSHRRSVAVERNLHLAMERWHTRGEWFRVRLDERALFNAAWRLVFERHSLEGGRRPRWERVALGRMKRNNAILPTVDPMRPGAA